MRMSGCDEICQSGRKAYILIMSVQEIQAALEQLSPVELREVEHCLLAQLRKAEGSDDGYAYGMKDTA